MAAEEEHAFGFDSARLSLPFCDKVGPRLTLLSRPLPKIDNYDLNAFPALPGHRPSSKVLKVNLARTMKNTPQMAGNGNRAIWANEEWLKEHALPLEQSGGLGEERPETKEKEEEEEVELEQ